MPKSIRAAAGRVEDSCDTGRVVCFFRSFEDPPRSQMKGVVNDVKNPGGTAPPPFYPWGIGSCRSLPTNRRRPPPRSAPFPPYSHLPQLPSFRSFKFKEAGSGAACGCGGAPAVHRAAVFVYLAPPPPCPLRAPPSHLGNCCNGRRPSLDDPRCFFFRNCALFCTKTSENRLPGIFNENHIQ